MPFTEKSVRRVLPRVVRRLRFPQLFLLTLALFLIDLFVPDLFPFVDEILLGLASLLLASWKRSPDPTAEDSQPPIDVEPGEPGG